MTPSQDKPIIPFPEADKPQPDLAKAVESWEGEGGRVAPTEDMPP
jgi:hypothetical protein